MLIIFPISYFDYLPECLPLYGLTIEELFDICDHASSS